MNESISNRYHKEKREERKKKVKKKGELCQERDVWVEEMWEHLEKSVWRGNVWVD